MHDTQAKPGRWKGLIIRELIEYLMNFLYLAVFLVAFVWYRRLILAEYHILYTNYWFPIIEAAILAKVIMIGDILRLGHGFEERPLILPTLYRTVVFSVWVALFSVVEATVRALLHGRGVTGGLDEIASKGGYEVLSWLLVIFVALLPFFALKELGRVLGEGKLRSMFWRQGTAAVAAPAE
jgi:hypothetical protein